MTSHGTSSNTSARARNLKASVVQNMSILQSAPTSPTAHAETGSFEDTIILALRSEGRPWGDIVAHLNERRASRKEAPTWTDKAVYSRFILRSSVTATPAREVGFEPSDYAHLKNAGSGREGTSKAGKKRVKDFQNATELSANIRTPAVVVSADGEQAVRVCSAEVKGKGKGNGKMKGRGKDEERRKGGAEEEVVKMDEGMIELLMQAVAKVERNFWVYVADEMEREAGKYVEPKELENVFHGI
ncbi:hypothetical protein SVAN01_11211 [Stagonosporopsis vannaccii]|nr:hypothetical protein SVAN01_11211 [Stagonosporopsis vannaccii]